MNGNEGTEMHNISNRLNSISFLLLQLATKNLMVQVIIFYFSDNFCAFRPFFCGFDRQYRWIVQCEVGHSKVFLIFQNNDYVKANEIEELKSDLKIIHFLYRTVS